MTRTEPYVAWRIWKITAIGDTGHFELESLRWGVFWPWHKRIEAEHHTKSFSHGHHTDQLDRCYCGIYGLWKLDDVLALLKKEMRWEWLCRFLKVPTQYAIGQVSLYGDIERPDVAVGPRGARAPYGYPKKLWLPDGDEILADTLCGAYGVPVTVGMPEHDNDEAGIHN